MDNLTFASLSSLTKETSSPNASTGKINPRSSAVANSPWRQFFYAIPTGLKQNFDAVDKNGLPLTTNKANYQIEVTHKGDKTSQYDVFYITNEADYGATTLTLTWH